MYHGTAASAGVGVLAYTGTDSVYAALAAFALLAAGMALLRIAPKIGRKKHN